LESLTAGTFVGAGSFRCSSCGYTLTLAGTETLTECPSCGGREFARASLFSHSTERMPPAPGEQTREALLESPGSDVAVRVERARAELAEQGEYLAYEEGDRIKVVPLTREWTRIGRSLAADVRFDDPTVSRRHALIVRQADGVRLLDDRSLNGVFVNGARVDGRALQDGDEIVLGRYRLLFLTVPPAPAGTAAGESGSSTFESRS
jgi:pSer/pThr/pTyr-binding forkhead associated (FHA) protein/DNA-directed RNA polymerase subunit RPC12/RpoP